MKKHGLVSLSKKSGFLALALGFTLGTSCFYTTNVEAAQAQTTSAANKGTVLDATQRAAENQIRHLLEPLLDKYCHDFCRLMNISVTLDSPKLSDTSAPGFEEAEIPNPTDLAPASAKAKLLIDDKLGPVSRGKLLDLFQQYLDTLDFPVKLDTQVTHFPQTPGSETRIAELRDKISKRFLNQVEDLLHQFCPQNCMLTDFNLQTEAVNGEEVQYGSPGEYVQDGDTALKIKSITSTLLMDESMNQEEQNNILEMARLKTNFFRNVNITGKSQKFPHPEPPKVAEDDSEDEDALTPEEAAAKAAQAEQDAYKKEMHYIKLFALIFGCAIIGLFILITLLNYASPKNRNDSTVNRIIQSLVSDPATAANGNHENGHKDSGSNQDVKRAEMQHTFTTRYEIDRLQEELTSIYAQQPRVAKHVFSKLLTEEGVETTAECIHVFGEGIIVDMLRDPSLQTDLAELTEYYAKTPIQLTDDQKLDLVRRLHSRTIAGKLAVLGNRSSNLFDFLAEMDGAQIFELIRTESPTVKSIVITQCDPQKRSVMYSQLDPEIRMQLLTELSRIDYLPRDFIFNVAQALKRKRRENPRLNTESLPGSEILVSLLERTGHEMQKSVIKTIEASNPESARTLKGKLISLDTLRYLRDGQLLEVILSLKHDELIQFLKGASDMIRGIIFNKAPKELVEELAEELEALGPVSREAYQGIERKILNRIKIMANDGHINLVETNERMFAEEQTNPEFVPSAPGDEKSEEQKVVNMTRAA